MSTASAEVESVAVQGDVTLRLSVQGAEEGAAASFEVKKVEDDSIVTTIQGEVHDGTARAAWDPSITPEGEARSLRVYYVVTVGDQTLRSQELEVYLDWVEVASVDEQAAALPDVPYRLTVGEEVREGTTGSTGTCRETGLPAGEVSFEWRGPYQLVEWLDESGPTRKAKLKRVQRMKFETPDPEGNGGRRAWQDDGTEVQLDARFHAWTQWVNLPYDATTDAGRACGSRLRCKVRAVEPEHARQGEKVYVKVEWPPAAELSARTEPARELVGGADQPWAQGDAQKGLELTFPEDGGSVEFEVELGLAGGDRVTVHVGGSDRCEDAKLVVTNRRRVLYQVTRLEHQSLPDLAPTRAWLDPVAIELGQDGADQLLTSDAPPLDGGPRSRGLARVPAAWLEEGATGDRLTIGRHNFNWYKTKLQNAANRLRTVHLVCADAIITGTGEDDFTNLSQRVTFDWDPVREEGSLTAFVPMPTPFRHEVFPQAFGDGGLVLRGARWRTPNGRRVPREFRNKRGDLDAAWVAVHRHRTETVTRTVDDRQVEEVRDGNKGVWVTLPADSLPGRALSAGVTVHLEGSLQVARVGQRGLAASYQIAVQQEDDLTLANFALTHELGHCMRMAPAPNPRWTDVQNRQMYLPPGFQFDQHPFLVRDNGFLGAHCSFGLDDQGATHHLSPGTGPQGADEHVPLEGAASASRRLHLLRKRVGDDYQPVAGTCLMYGRADATSAGVTVGFCEHCTRFLQAHDLQNLHVQSPVSALEGDDEVGPASISPDQPMLRLQLLDELHRPCANASYELSLPSGRAASGTTDAEGWLEEPLPEEDKADAVLRLKYTPEGADEAIETEFHMTASMDEDCDSDAVFAAHLRSLGFLRAGESTAAGVARLQGAVGLPASGVLDDPTKDAIDELLREEGELASLHPPDWEA